MRLPISYYKIQWLSDDLLHDFYTFFNIKHGKGNFKFNDFCAILNRQIPLKVRSLDDTKRELLSITLNLEEPNAIYFKGFKNWEEINVRHQQEIGHRTKRNESKVMLLYPDIYKIIKDYDISVIFSSDSKYKNKYSDFMKNPNINAYL